MSFLSQTWLKFSEGGHSGGTSGCVLDLSEDRDVSVFLSLDKGPVAKTQSSHVSLMSSNPTSKDFKEWCGLLFYSPM